MRNQNPYLSSNPSLYYDHIFGFRGWGLILYGTLPASLFALGVLKVTSLELQQIHSLVPLFMVAIVPVVVLFLLIRERLAAWYLMRDGLYFRTSLITGGIMFLSTLTSLSAGVITGEYQIVSWQEWQILNPNLRWFPYLESVLLSVMAIVGSSTLFLTAVKESGGLPGLPSPKFVDDIKSLRESLFNIQNNPIWHDENCSNISGLTDNTEKAKKTLVRLINYPASRLGKLDFYNRLDSDLTALKRAADQVESVPLKWNDYFAADLPAGLNLEELDLRRAATNLNKVRLNV